jgi:hypothetical protein
MQWRQCIKDRWSKPAVVADIQYVKCNKGIGAETVKQKGFKKNQRSEKLDTVVYALNTSEAACRASLSVQPSQRDSSRDYSFVLLGENYCTEKAASGSAFLQ